MRCAPALVIGILALVGCSGHGETVAMADLPPAVRATLDAQAKGAKTIEVEKETKHGKTVYCADVTAATGQEWDITIGEDGTLISKERD